MSQWFQFNTNDCTNCQCIIKYTTIRKLTYIPNKDDPTSVDYQFFYLNNREDVTLNSTDSENFITNFNSVTNANIKYQYIYKNITTIVILDDLEFLFVNSNELRLFYNYNTIFLLFDTYEDAVPSIDAIKSLINF